MPHARAELLARLARGEDVLDGLVQTGQRSPEEIAQRLRALVEDAEAPPIAAAELQQLEAVLAVRDKLPAALSRLQSMAGTTPALAPAVERLGRRMQALSDKGVDVAALDFEASYGRTNMEYYDGFVFGFYAEADAEMPPVATGGRYDALTAVLGQGRSIPAVGGVIRPGLVARLKGVL